MALKFSIKKPTQPAGMQPPRRVKSITASKLYKAKKNSRFVLFIGDEGAILVYLKGRTVISRQFVPDASQQNLSELRQTLDKDINAPLLMLIDSMDQSYVQQSLPPVSRLSVGKLIKRRLDRDFAANDIKGALILGRDNSARKDWNFMMIAQERSPQLDIWLDYVRELPHRFEGIRLVSVEVEEILKIIDRAQQSPDKSAVEWKFLVSHHKVAGFRQVILRHGRIVFTRLAQPLADSNPEVIAGSIEQEMLSTIEYMKRLSFSPQAGLEIITVTSQPIRDVIDFKKFGATQVHSFTPFELAQLFGIEGATQPTDQFGDVVIAALVGASARHVLPLAVPQFRKIDQCYQIIAIQRVLAVVILLGAVAFSAHAAYEIYTTNSAIDVLNRDKESNQRTLDALREEIKRTNLDVERSTDLIDLHAQLKKERTDPYVFIERFRSLVAPPITLKSIEWEVSDTKPASPVVDAAAPPAPPPASPDNTKKQRWIKVNLVVELPGIASDTRKRIAIINKVVKDFSDRLPGYEVIADRTLIDQARESEQNRRIASSRETASQQDADAQPTENAVVEEKITIIGPMEPPPPVVTTPAITPAAAAPPNAAPTEPPVQTGGSQ
ncbi:MAG: hypothetical protein SFW63_03965 [Alphaproteobacteria bacterium]|nr:hypothetical protein [Alphaproteobacteria bacterium]